MLSSHSRLHGSGSYRVPWAYDDEAVDVLRHFTRLKLSLMPYLAAAAQDAHRDGTPVMRPMFLEFPDDPATAYLDRQYMLGPDVLVARCSARTATSRTTYPPAPGRTWSPARRSPVRAG
ncbi:TIM-barrel domain-containing protein [Micromonospora sp. M12]